MAGSRPGFLLHSHQVLAEFKSAGDRDPGEARPADAAARTAAAAPARSRADAWAETAKMMTLSRSATIARATVVAFLTAGLGPRAAGADDQIKVGKWEFTVQVPGVTKLPPALA
jgi:hypothetical protein